MILEFFAETVVDSNAKQSQKVSTELLLNLLTTPSGKCKFVFYFMNIPS